MKLLLDESVPKPLARSFPDAFEVRTAQQMGWASVENGELLRCARDQGFDALITVDKGFEHQQSERSLLVPVVLLTARQNSFPLLQPLVPEAIAVLTSGLERRVYVVPQD